MVSSSYLHRALILDSASPSIDLTFHHCRTTKKAKQLISDMLYLLKMYLMYVSFWVFNKLRLNIQGYIWFIQRHMFTSHISYVSAFKVLWVLSSDSFLKESSSWPEKLLRPENWYCAAAAELFEWHRCDLKLDLRTRLLCCSVSRGAQIWSVWLMEEGVNVDVSLSSLPLTATEEWLCLHSSHWRNAWFNSVWRLCLPWIKLNDTHFHNSHKHCIHKMKDIGWVIFSFQFKSHLVRQHVIWAFQQDLCKLILFVQK